MQEFVPAADEVWSLQNRKDQEALLFQKIAEQGHYAGRTQPSNTRQGTYATTPGGTLLASINSNDPRAMAGMMQRALSKWKFIEDKDRWLDGEVKPGVAQGRPEALYPEDGLVLRQTVRDLPRDNRTEDWRTQAWNKDYVWFRRGEMLAMAPTRFEVGEKRSLPAPILNRMGRIDFMDTVRGQSFHFPSEAIQKAELVAEVVSVRGETAQMKLTGGFKAEQIGTWPIAGYRDMNNPTPQKRGYDLEIEGAATWDAAQQKFTKFEFVAVGNRWGSTQYNGRHDDPGPAPIGYFFQIASKEPHDRVPPSTFSLYGWR